MYAYISIYVYIRFIISQSERVHFPYGDYKRRGHPESRFLVPKNRRARILDAFVQDSDSPYYIDLLDVSRVID